MNNRTSIGPWVRRFLLEYLVEERNLARNTQASYRDTLTLLLPFASRVTRTPIDRLNVEAISPMVVRRFLQHLEDDRGCSVATRNQRLAAIHSLSRFIATHSPQHLAWCTENRTIPFKKTPHPVMAYLEKSEMDALLRAPDQRTSPGRRDYAVLLFLYNTGARADEAARLIIADLSWRSSPSVRIVGKANKVRHCPLWTSTTKALGPLVAERELHESVFLSRRQEPLTRFGIRAIVKRCVARADPRVPSLQAKPVTTHTIRHTTAVHLLRSGVDINTIRAWLGHVSLETTNVYAEIDMKTKADALAHCEISPHNSNKPWRKEPALMAFLKAL